MKNLNRRPDFREDIQGLRAIAVILVLLFHFETRLQGGYLGVDMFFVISGFVIASSSLREIGSTSSFSWGSFLHRRVRRLLPGMALVTLATAIGSLFMISPFGPQKEAAKMLLSAASYTSNFVLMPQNYFSLDPKSNPLLHLWSLAVEEQFYLVWPIAVIVLVALRSRIHARVFKLVVLAAASVVLVASCWLFLMCSIHGSQVNDFKLFWPLIRRNITPERFAFYSPLTRAWEFVAGVLVALLVRTRIASRKPFIGSAISGCGVTLVFVGIAWASKFPEVQHDMNWATNTSATLAVVAGTSLWIFGGLNDNLIRPLISIRPLTVIGNCSYSIYLLHWPIWVFIITTYKHNNISIAAAFALALGLGWLQFRFIEEPIRMRTKLVSFNTIHFVGVFGVVAIVVVACMSYTRPIIAMHLTGIKPGEISSHIAEKPCAEKRVKFENALSCTYLTANNVGTVVLVGDSMAKSLSDGFVQAAGTRSLNSYVFSYPGCAFLLSDSPFTATSECESWRKEAFAAIEEIRPDVVVIANLSSIYVATPFPDWTLANTQLLWGSELTRTIDKLNSVGTKFIIMQPPPSFAFDLRYDISLVRQNFIKEPRGVVLARRELINNIEVNATSGLDSVSAVVNFSSIFCNEKTCDPRVNGEIMLEDDDHLSVHGSLLIAPIIEGAIKAALAK
jgi:peptidoglycan/LPS O-acetylase OafA/YrhL